MLYYITLLTLYIFFCMYFPSARYEDLEQTDVRVQYLWEALMNFTNG